MSTQESNFEFLKEIIDREEDEHTRELLQNIKDKSQNAEEQLAINHKIDYRACFMCMDAACDDIAWFYLEKKIPDHPKKIDGKDKIWNLDQYVEDWEHDAKDIKLYVELFKLKDEANCLKHKNRGTIKYPITYADENGKLILKKDENGKVLKDEVPAEPKKYKTYRNADIRLENLFDYLCAVLSKCGYISHEEIPEYKSPKPLSALSEEDISDIKELKEELQLFNEYVEINKAVNQEEDSTIRYGNKGLINKQRAVDIAPKNENRNDDENKVLKRIIAIAAVILLVLIALIAVNRMRSSNGGLTSSKGASVYYSKIIPYTEAGKYESYASSSDVSDYLEADKAIALLSFIKNEAPDVAVVEDITCKLEEIEEIVEPNLKTDAALVDNVLKIYVMNDGNGESSEVSLDIYGDGLELGDYTSETLKNEIKGLQSGEIVEAAEYRLLSEEFIKQNVEEVKIVLKLNDNISEVITVFYDPVEDEFSLAGGIGDAGAEITLFSVLDVDSKPKSISFNPEKITTIEDALRIETVLAPTKSCKIRFRGSYTVDGNTEETEPYTATITVPIYRDRAFGLRGELTNELANDSNNSKAHVKQVAQKYLYDPEALNTKNDE